MLFASHLAFALDNRGVWMRDNNVDVDDDDDVDDEEMINRYCNVAMWPCACCDWKKAFGLVQPPPFS